ncbi:hypothetical protein AX14_009385 [Amanita brunnescens Koide BX004]|nr:hypothetical protein AX14_009385 [Amanita brunnescens Koide BX004]
MAGKSELHEDGWEREDGTRAVEATKIVGARAEPSPRLKGREAPTRASAAGRAPGGIGTAPFKASSNYAQRIGQSTAGSPNEPSTQAADTFYPWRGDEQGDGRRMARYPGERSIRRLEADGKRARAGCIGARLLSQGINGPR